MFKVVRLPFYLLLLVIITPIFVLVSALWFLLCILIYLFIFSCAFFLYPIYAPFTFLGAAFTNNKELLEALNLVKTLDALVKGIPNYFQETFLNKVDKWADAYRYANSFLEHGL